MDNVEESKEDWKGCKIIRAGKYWVVRNTTRYIGGNFTTLFAAERYLNSLQNLEKDKEYKKNLKEVLKEPIKNRKRKFKEKCQTPVYQ